MIAAAQVKPHPDSITFRVMDMLEMETKQPVQAIVCYCDSLNYLASLDQVAQFIPESGGFVKKRRRAVVRYAHSGATQRVR